MFSPTLHNPSTRQSRASYVEMILTMKPSIFYDDDDEESSIPLRDIISELPLSVAIAPDLPITDSLIMEDEHLNTIPETESDKENESSVKDLNLTPSESEDLSDNKSECDMLVCDDSSSKNEGLDDIISISPGNEIDQLDDIPDSVQSLLNRANSIIFLIEEFTGKLAPIDPIPPRELLKPIGRRYSSLLPDYDSEGDVLFLEELLNDDSLSLLEYESFHVRFYNVLSSPRSPEKPPDDDVYFDIEPDTRVLTTKVVDDISDNSTRELYVHVPNVLPTLYTVFDTLLPFSSKNEDKVFNPGILISKEKKSPRILSHQGFKVF
ncbi:hypothetical protein Tco_0677352 [Tanacetum coccineum]|uniref:Reverse transcriptase domain-containing protein n=1 Tax=Tanacetum coccineum TaxID=301880 RepID=A0ABQ4XBY6_9ASTR